MTRLLHISDTHFGTELPAVVSALRAAVAKHMPDVVVLSGDITQRARASQFAAARAFCDSLNVPVLAVPGNHDIPLYHAFDRVLRPYRNYERYFGAREWVASHGGLGIVGFDATSPWRHTRGKLTAAHVEDKLAAARAQAGDAMLIAVVHQPVAVAWPEDTDEILINAHAVAEVFARYRVAAVLSGHVHVPMLAQSDTIFADMTPTFLHSGAGTATSWRVRPCAPNSYTLLECDTANHRIDARIYIYDAAQTAFIPAP